MMVSLRLTFISHFALGELGAPSHVFRATYSQIDTRDMSQGSREAHGS
jgi:hypothetical protein